MQFCSTKNFRQAICQYGSCLICNLKRSLKIGTMHSHGSLDNLNIKLLIITFENYLHQSMMIKIKF